MTSGLEVGDRRGSRVGRGFFRYDVREATGEGHLRSDRENEQGVASLAKSRRCGSLF